MAIEKLNFEKKQDNPTRVSQIVKANLPSNQYSRSSEYNAIAEKINEMIPEINAGVTGYQGKIYPDDKKDAIGFYFAAESGVYPYAGNFTIDIAEGINHLMFDGNKWDKMLTPIEATGKVEEGNKGIVNGNETFKALVNSKRYFNNRIDQLNLGIINIDGSIIDSKNYVWSGYIFVLEGEVYELMLRYRGRERFLCYMYDNNYRLLYKKVHVNKNVVQDTIVNVVEKVLIPEGVSYMSMFTMSTQNPNFEEGHFKIQYLRNISDNVLDSFDIDLTYLEKGSINKDTGQEVESNIYLRSDYLPCSYLDIITISIRLNGSTISTYDINKKFIGNKLYDNKGNYVTDFINEDKNAAFFKVITMDKSHQDYVPYDFYVKYKTKQRQAVTMNSNDKEYSLDISSISLINPDGNVEYPTLKATKMQRNVRYDYTPVAWYYQSNIVLGKEIFYKSDGRSDNEMKKLFTWQKELTDNGNRSASDYNMSVLENGDCLFVFRTEILDTEGNKVANDNVRSNPIIYPASNYEEPYIIDFEDTIKPTAWGCADGGFFSDDNVFYIAEYTRRITSKGYLWRVEGDYSNPLNWKRVVEYDVSRDNMGFKHFHVVDKDPYTGYIYYTTGDYQAEVHVSKNNGVSFEKVLGPSEEICRLTSFVWLEDAVYWSTDAWNPSLHKAFKCRRGVDGVLDKETLEIIHDFGHLTYGAATYKTSYLRDINSLIFFNRYDAEQSEPLEMFIYDLSTKKMIKVGEILPLKKSKYGFRCTHISVYQGNNEKGIVCGFDLYPNIMKVLNNKENNLVEGLQNLKIKIY